MKVRVLTSGHHEDRGDDALVAVFDGDASDSQIVDVLIRWYFLAEHHVPRPTTFDEIGDCIGNFAWFNVDDLETVPPVDATR